MLMPSETLDYFVSDLFLGGLSAFAAKTVAAPFMTIKTALKLQKTSTRVSKAMPCTGILNCFVRIAKEQGVLSLWRGNLISLYGYAPVHGFNFAFRNCYKSQIPIHSRDDSDFFVKNVLTGSLSAATTQLIMHPILVCLFLSRTASNQQTDFKKLSDCMKRTVKYRGIAGLYQGFYGFTVALVIYRGLYFSLYDTGKLYMKKYHLEPNLFTSFILAQMATLTAGVVTYPMDCVRWRLMNDLRQPNTKKKYLGVMDCWMKTYHSEGPSGFFSGCLASLLRSTVTALVLVFYDEFNHLRTKKLTP